MPNDPRRPIVLILVLLLALVVAGCSRIAGPRTWTSSAELVAGGSYVIDVRDASGRIDDVEIDPPNLDPGPDAVANPPGQPNVLLVGWTGGACDERTDVDIASSGPGLEIRIHTAVANRDCDAIGIGHSLQLTSSQPLPAAAVKVTTVP